jgi:enamine deaminase RidA (YjgF/YER057c/UK114 family)
MKEAGSSKATFDPAARRVIEAPGIPRPPGWSSAVSAGQWVFVSGMMATDYRSGLTPDARIDERNPFVTDALELQSKRSLSDITAILAAAGCDIRRDIIRAWQWFPSNYPADAEFSAGRSLWPRFKSPLEGYTRLLKTMVGDSRRSSTGLGVRRLSIPGALMAVDLLAVKQQNGIEKVGIKGPPGTPYADLPFSPATRFGDWVFLAGFGATDYAGDFMSERHMGEPSNIAPEARVNPYFLGGSEIEKQTEYTLRMLSKVAEAAGTSLDRCVKADVAIGHPGDFLGMDLVWRKWFPNNPPARSVVTGAQLVMKGLRVEIAMQLLASDSDLRREAISAGSVAPSFGNDPHAMRAGDLLFLSTQLPIDQTGTVPPLLACNLAAPYFNNCPYAQTDYLLQKVAAICEAGGSSLGNVCKVQMFLDDMNILPSVLQAWREAFPVDPPALTVLEMGGGQPLLVPGAHVQMDVIAYVP